MRVIFRTVDGSSWQATWHIALKELIEAGVDSPVLFYKHKLYPSERGNLQGTRGSRRGRRQAGIPADSRRFRAVQALLQFECLNVLCAWAAAWILVESDGSRYIGSCANTPPGCQSKRALNAASELFCRSLQAMSRSRGDSDIRSLECSIHQGLVSR